MIGAMLQASHSTVTGKYLQAFSLQVADRARIAIEARAARRKSDQSGRYEALDGLISVVPARNRRLCWNSKRGNCRLRYTPQEIWGPWTPTGVRLQVPTHIGKLLGRRFAICDPSRHSPDGSQKRVIIRDEERCRRKLLLRHERCHALYRAWQDWRIECTTTVSSPTRP